jgi:hypothetical protein
VSAGAAAAITACGGDDDDSTTAASTTATTTTPATARPTTTVNEYGNANVGPDLAAYEAGLLECSRFPPAVLAALYHAPRKPPRHRLCLRAAPGHGLHHPGGRRLPRRAHQTGCPKLKRRDRLACRASRPPPVRLTRGVTPGSQWNANPLIRALCAEGMGFEPMVTRRPQRLSRPTVRVFHRRV